MMDEPKKLREARRALRLISIGPRKCENYWKDHTCPDRWPEEDGQVWCR